MRRFLPFGFILHIDAALVVIGAYPQLAAEELALVESVAKSVRDVDPSP